MQEEADKIRRKVLQGLCLSRGSHATCQCPDASPHIAIVPGKDWRHMFCARHWKTALCAPPSFRDRVPIEHKVHALSTWHYINHYCKLIPVCNVRVACMDGKNSIMYSDKTIKDQIKVRPRTNVQPEKASCPCTEGALQAAFRSGLHHQTSIMQPGTHDPERKEAWEQTSTFAVSTSCTRTL